MKTTKMLLEYIATCSKTSLESFELARLNDRANLRKQMIEILDELIEVDVQARIAEWVLVQRRREQAQHQAGLLRHPQHVFRGASLQSATVLRQLHPEESEDLDRAAEIMHHPVLAALREALPNGPLHARQEKTPATQVRAPAPASCAQASEPDIAIKSKRIA